MSPLIKKIHRVGGLLIAGVIFFYCITGVILNHRKSFNYFNNDETTFHSVEKYDTRQLLSFIDFYKQQIGRDDDPKVIRIKKEGTIEFLYGSHGSLTYEISPHMGELKKIIKNPVEPLTKLNNFHKTFKTSSLWAVGSDILALVIMVVVATGLTLFSYKLKDWMLLLGGLIILILGMVIG